MYIKYIYNYIYIYIYFFFQLSPTNQGWWSCPIEFVSLNPLARHAERLISHVRSFDDRRDLLLKAR